MKKEDYRVIQDIRYEKRTRKKKQSPGPGTGIYYQGKTKNK